MFLMPRLLVAVVVLCTAMAVGIILVQKRDSSPPTQAFVATNITLPTLWPVPAFNYVDQNGRTITNKDLLGHVWICDFIYTQCTTACPLLTARLSLLQRKLTADSLRFVSFTVDPQHDTPAVLKDYAAQWHGDSNRWELLATGRDEAIKATAEAMHVTVEKTDDAANPLLHTTRFLLVDAAGNVRALYDSDDEDAMTRLARDTQRLLGTADFKSAPGDTTPNDPVAAGRELFATVGCLACHARPQIAPTMNGLAGSVVTLQDGQTLMADDAYLRESIVDAGAKRVAGYVVGMPNYGTQLTAGQVDALVAYVKSLPASPSSAATQPAVIAIDPVCHMHVRVVSATPTANVAGKTYYFCSDSCRQKFLAAPGDHGATAATQAAMNP